MIAINGKIWQRVDTAANWASLNPVLENKEQGFDSTNKAFKIGDGATAWNALPFYYPTSVIADTELDYSLHTPLPIILNMATTYPQYGKYPKFLIIIMSGDDSGKDITSAASINRGVTFPSTSLTINADDDGTGQTNSAIRIIIYK